MDQETFKAILKKHLDWLNGNGGELADLSGVNLSDADLSGMNLYYVNLADANLARANLADANLADANLADANLADANLADANLARANLARANLARANFTNANLAIANLYRANLLLSYLHNVDITGACLPSPSMVLLANWENLSPVLTAKAMVYDAFFHDDPSAFTVWANGGECPYCDRKYQRACNFYESRRLWDPDLPCPRGFDLMVEIIKEKCAGSDWHPKNKD